MPAQTFTGLVVAAKRMPKTITVHVTRYKPHPVVGKMIKQGKKMLTHDPENKANVGDKVLIQNCRPISAAKRHILVDIVKQAKVVGGVRGNVAATEEIKTLAGAKKEGQRQRSEADAQVQRALEAPKVSSGQARAQLRT